MAKKRERGSGRGEPPPPAMLALEAEDGGVVAPVKQIKIRLVPEDNVAHVLVSPQATGDPAFTASPAYGSPLLLRACAAMTAQAASRATKVFVRLEKHPANELIMRIVDVRAEPMK